MNELEVDLLGVLKYDKNFTSYDHHSVSFNDTLPYPCKIYIKHEFDGKWLEIDKDCYVYVMEDGLRIVSRVEHLWDWNNYFVHITLGVMWDTNIVIRIEDHLDIRCEASDYDSLLNYFLREGEFLGRSDDDIFILRYR